MITFEEFDIEPAPVPPPIVPSDGTHYLYLGHVCRIHRKEYRSGKAFYVLAWVAPRGVVNESTSLAEVEHFDAHAKSIG